MAREGLSAKRATVYAPSSLEFKAGAARLFRESGRPLQQIADELGVSSNSLREWVKRSDIASGARPGLKTDETAKDNRLRRENGVLRKEREILKKTAVFFAEETKSRR